MQRYQLTATFEELQDLRVIPEAADYSASSIEEFAHGMIEDVFAWFMTETRNGTHHQATFVHVLRILPLVELIRFLTYADFYDDFDESQRDLIESALHEALSIEM